MSAKTKLSAHDRHMRALLVDPAIAREVLERILPPHLLARLNLDTLKPVPTSFINTALREKIADVLYQVEADGVTAYIDLFILIEHTSRASRFLPLRLGNYSLEVAINVAEKTKARKLPLVIPILIHNGPKPYRHSLDVRDLFDEPKELVEQAILGPFQLVDLHTMPDEAFNDFPKFGAGGFVAKHIFDEDLTPVAQAIAQHLSALEKQHETSHISRILEYMLTRGNVGDPADFVHTLGEHLTDLNEEKS